jgi:hemerythrin
MMVTLYLQFVVTLSAMVNFLIKWNPAFEAIIQKEDSQQKLFQEISSKLEGASLETLKSLQQQIELQLKTFSNPTPVTNKLENPFLTEFTYKVLENRSEEEFDSLLEMLYTMCQDYDSSNHILEQIKNTNFDFINFLSTHFEKVFFFF